VAFAREKSKPKGPPSGGNGGRGGDVIFVVSPNHTSLHYLQRSIAAGNGETGKGQLRHGAAGKDVAIPIPMGTVVREVDPPAKKPQEDELSDKDAEIRARRATTWVHYPRYEQ